MTKEDHNFDWVTARQNCCLRSEFTALRLKVEEDTDERQKNFNPNYKEGVKFEVLNGRAFIVVRNAILPESVTFVLKEDCIVVEASKGSSKFKLTLTLNDDGKCRFKINGEGTYLRWQVARKALEELFFQGLEAQQQ